MKNLLSVFSNVKRIVDALFTIESQLARLIYLYGELVEKIDSIEKVD